jgi:hypothetical protein
MNLNLNSSPKSVMLPTYRTRSGPSTHELPIRSSPGSSFLHSPPPSPPKATRGPPSTSSDSATRDWKKPSGPSVPIVTQTEAEDPVPFYSFPRPSLFRVSGSPNSNATGLPTPRPSLEFPATTRPLAFDDVVSTLKPLLEGTAEIRELLIDGVTLDIVEELRTKSRASKLPGWERLRYDKF